MSTTTNEVRQGIKSRLASVRSEKGDGFEVKAVLNPVEVREKSKVPKDGLYAVVWTEPSKVLEQRGCAFKWRQPFAIDVPINFSVLGEEGVDELRSQIGRALVEKLPGVLKWELSDFVTQYPQQGNGGVVSVTVTVQYVENVK